MVQLESVKMLAQNNSSDIFSLSLPLISKSETFLLQQIFTELHMNYT
jgi:hypothetical protein